MLEPDMLGFLKGFQKEWNKHLFRSDKNTERFDKFVENFDAKIEELEK